MHCATLVGIEAKSKIAVHSITMLSPLHACMCVLVAVANGALIEFTMLNYANDYVPMLFYIIRIIASNVHSHRSRRHHHHRFKFISIDHSAIKDFFL